MAERVQVRDLTNDEGRKLLSIIGGVRGRWCGGDERRSCCGRRSAMDVPAIAKIAFTSEDRVREVIHNFNDDGFDSLDTRSTPVAGHRRSRCRSASEIKKIALSRPTDHDLPFSTWSLVEAGRVLGG